MQRPSTIWQEANEETKQPHTVKHKLDGHRLGCSILYKLGYGSRIAQ